MAIDSGYFESKDDYMSTDEIAVALVKLYAEYRSFTGDNDDYAYAVGVAIRMLTD